MMTAPAVLVYVVGAARAASLRGGRWSLTEPRSEYDWRCWLMRGSYNCKDDPRDPPATAWRHVDATNRSWRAVVRDRGGPFAVARRLR